MLRNPHARPHDYTKVELDVEIALYNLRRRYGACALHTTRDVAEVAGRSISATRGALRALNEADCPGIGGPSVSLHDRTYPTTWRLTDAAWKMYEEVRACEEWDEAMSIAWKAAAEGIKIRTND